MGEESVLDLADLPAGAVREAVADGKSYAVCNVDGVIYAVSGDCPHRNGPLGHGALHGFHLVCPWHLWAFDVRTGECDVSPDCRIAIYPARIRNGFVVIETSDARTS